MRTECERCHMALGWESGAFICSHECTFCVSCAQAMAGACPNCAGELAARPRRRAVPAGA